MGRGLPNTMEEKIEEQRGGGGGGSRDGEERVGEQIGLEMRGVGGWCRLSWCLHRALSHRLSPVSHAWPL